MTTKADKLIELAIDIKTCRKCSLCNTRTQVAISRGDSRSPLMIISDYPRQSDDKVGLTLQGRSGKKLDSLLEKVGLKPEQVYMTSLLKCWPGTKGHFPEDNTPAQCFPFLLRQIELIRPLVIVLVGPEVLNWTLLRGTGERVSPKGEDLHKWMGRTLRRSEIYKDTRFVVIPSLMALLKDKIKSLEEPTIQALTISKEFIVARQSGTFAPHIIVDDVKVIPEHSKKDQGELIKWVKPTPKLDDPPTEAAQQS